MDSRQKRELKKTAKNERSSDTPPPSDREVHHCERLHVVFQSDRRRRQQRRQPKWTPRPKNRGQRIWSGLSTDVKQGVASRFRWCPQLRTSTPRRFIAP